MVGTCGNFNCRIQKVRQNFPKGLGAFSLNKEVYAQKCIVCSESLSPDNVTNILFYRCDFKIEGVAEGKKRESSGTTGKEKFITFKDEQHEELTNWNYLEVTATAL